MARIFLTGATGYIGGDALHTLYRAHPEYQISALVRDPAKSADVFAKEYPNVRIVQGSLDDGDLVADEAAKADVVLNLAATSHLPSVKSIHQGLKKASSSRNGKPAHWLQISGATVLACGEIASKTFGEPSDKVYHDLDSGEIWAQVKKYPSRAVDNYIHDVATSQDAAGTTVNTALLVGPIIFGAGRGPGNRRSIQIPELARTAIERRRAWHVGRGLSVWDHVHVRDLSGITLRLVERAVGGGGGDQSTGLWGEEGVYFAGVGHLAFADISRRIAAAAYALGLADSPDAVDALPPAEADKLVGHASILLGTNARCDARRAVEKLGWSPKEQSLEQAIEETVRNEAGKVGKAEL